MEVPTKAISKLLTSAVIFELASQKSFIARDVYEQTKSLTNYDVFVIEIFREIIKQVLSKSPLAIRDEIDTLNLFDACRSLKG